MDSGKCSYDCSQRPDKLKSDTDISGIGISLAYNSTAFLALFVVLSYYVIAYRPEIDPFHRATGSRDSQNTLVYQPNPVDMRLLRWRAEWARINSQSNPKLAARTRRVASALTASMLMMSDLQLLTGIGILISGFARLRCGMSTYHWQRIVNLAWFSSVTHLCCLTFLREHLRRNKILQTWRIPGMIALTLMLMVALTTTLSYEWRFGWTGGEVTPYDQAVCFLRPISKAYGVSGGDAFQRTMISLIMISFGMINRIARLYERPYNFIIRARARCSRLAIMILDYNHRKCCSSISVTSSARAVFVYRPLLGLFLLARVLLDILTSKAFEAWWLLQAFLLGTLKLWWRVAVPEPESKQWRFGQILAVVLLVSPALSMVEGWNDKNILASPEQTPTSSSVSTIPLITLQQDESSRTDATTANRVSLKGPNYDFYIYTSYLLLLWSQHGYPCRRYYYARVSTVIHFSFSWRHLASVVDCLYVFPRASLYYLEH
ncbi:hypothetical protein BKA63DRAFT_561142 [Paraphoma chrysanthemicola]|nr:hypothetical protein BKA63DRAFT_561142 [Paraphoma chrysanthemicola]